MTFFFIYFTNSRFAMEMLTFNSKFIFKNETILSTDENFMAKAQQEDLIKKNQASVIHHETEYASSK